MKVIVNRDRENTLGRACPEIRVVLDGEIAGGGARACSRGCLARGWGLLSRPRTTESRLHGGAISITAGTRTPGLQSISFGDPTPCAGAPRWRDASVLDEKWAAGIDKSIRIRSVDLSGSTGGPE